MPFSYFSTLKGVFKKPISILVIHGSSDYFLGLRNLEGGINYRLFDYGIISAFPELQRYFRPFLAASDSLLVNHFGDFSVVGAVSRVFSVPSVSGPSLQACAYHIDSCKASVSKDVTKKTMNFSASRPSVFRYNGNCSSMFIDGSLRHTKVHAQQIIPNYLVYNNWNLMEIGLRRFHVTSIALFSAGTASDATLKTSSPLQMKENDNRFVEFNEGSSTKDLKLLSGSCYLPHPDKVETGGEDAHFICENEQAIGVADGVGGWADLGIDAGDYSRELMSNSVNAIEKEPKGAIDPARVLEKAHSITKAKGSSTACIIALTEKGLNAINLGDSGFMVVREGCTIFRSPAQQHDFNFTYQLESGNKGDLPSSGLVFSINVAAGDVVIAGTDGLFDNLYNNEITAVVVHAVRAGLGPQVTAQKIAALARQRAEEKDRQTPFSAAAQEAGFRYYGGKLDDITVVVSFITNNGIGYLERS